MSQETEQSDFKTETIDRVAHAIWDSQRKREIAELDRFEFDSATFAEAKNIIDQPSDGMALIAGWATLEECLEAGIRFHLKHGTPKEQKEFLQGFGPLATDSSRVRFALLMGWITNDDRDFLNPIRKSRNEIAHGIIPDSAISFPSNLRKDLAVEISEKLDRMIDAAREVDGEKVLRIKIPDSAKWRVFFFLIANDVLEAIVCGPGRQRLQMSEGNRTFFGSEDAPEWVNNNRKSIARAILELGASRVF